MSHVFHSISAVMKIFWNIWWGCWQRSHQVGFRYIYICIHMKMSLFHRGCNEHSALLIHLLVISLDYTFDKLLGLFQKSRLKSYHHSLKPESYIFKWLVPPQTRSCPLYNAIQWREASNPCIWKAAGSREWSEYCAENAINCWSKQLQLHFLSID